MNNIEHQEHHQHNEGGIMTIEQLLGPKANIDAIVVDLGRILRNKENQGFVFSVFDDDGMHLTEDCLRARGNRNQRVDLLEYKDMFSQWQRFLKKWGIADLPYEEQIKKVHLLARVLHCNGREEAKSIDFGYDAEAQNNPEGRVECPRLN
ncbi:MAG: hypothetical protein Q8L52_00225 [bacterium]|nr:hypothetical protein [bacterium]